MQHTHTATPPHPNSSYLTTDIWGGSRIFFKLSKGKKCISSEATEIPHHVRKYLVSHSQNNLLSLQY